MVLIYTKCDVASLYSVRAIALSIMYVMESECAGFSGISYRINYYRVRGFNMNLYSIEKQHERGKLHVTERINILFDKGTFVGNGNASLGEQQDGAVYDGVVTGYGEINGQRVYFYGQDYTYMGGTFGLNHSRQIGAIIEEAIAHKCPVIGIYDSGGARIQEGANSVGGCGELFNINVRASGYIPQISIVAGTCAGGAVYSPGLTDFIFTIDDISNMFVTGARVINQVCGTDYLSEELGGAYIHATESGVSHFRMANEEECYNKVRKLIGIIPPCYEENRVRVTGEYVKKDLSLLQRFLPQDINEAYDIKSIIYALFDVGSFMEVQEEFARNIIVGFAALGGIIVGIVASEPNYKNGVIDCDGADKASRFVEYCDSFNIPIITLADSTGFLMEATEEKKGLIRHGAKMVYAYANATTIKLTVIVRKAFGGPYIFLGSKQLGADKSYVWPGAQVAVMGAEGAVAVIYHNQIYRVEGDKEEYVRERTREYEEVYMNSKTVLDGGFVDEEILAEDTRDVLYNDLLKYSKEDIKPRLNKKHGNMPV